MNFGAKRGGRISTPKLSSGLTAGTFRCWKKAELHAHLNGCIPTHVVQQLLKDFRVPIPAGFDPGLDLQVLQPVSGLREYFRPWNLLKLLPVGRECLFQMVSASLGSLRDDGVEYVELRNSPFSIAVQNDIPLTKCREWITDAFEHASHTHKIDARLILSLSRHDCSPVQAKQLVDAIKNTTIRERIVGMDLSGDEDKVIDRTIAKYFRIAKDELGLGISIHAGETFIASNVEWAINECSADRIGHALAIATEPWLLDLIESKRICIEVCLTSNLLTSRITQLSTHPVEQLIARNLPFVLCSDNPAIHGQSLSDEYHLFSSTFPSSQVLDTMYDTQMAYAFRGINQ